MSNTPKAPVPGATIRFVPLDNLYYPLSKGRQPLKTSLAVGSIGGEGLSIGFDGVGCIALNKEDALSLAFCIYRLCGKGGKTPC